jgi:hypothetical protein
MNGKQMLRIFVTWLLFSLVIGFVSWRLVLYQQVEGRLAAIRAAGRPASGQELNAWRLAVPDRENGALVLTQAFALARTFPDSRSNLVVAPELLKRGNQWSAETRALVAAYVSTNAAALAKTREAAQFQQFRFPVDFSFGPDAELPHLGRLKNLAGIIALQAALAADEGRSEEWTEQTELLLTLARAIDEEPSVISHLVHNAILRTAATTTERCLARAAPGEDSCRQLQIAFASAGETNRLARALIGERALLIPVFRLSWAEIQSASQGAGEGTQTHKPHAYSGKPATIVWLTGFMERDLNFFLQTMDRCITVAQLPPPENLNLTNEMMTASEVARRKHYLMSTMLLPAYTALVRREATLRARVELAQLGVALQRFHNQHAQWPEDLRALTPQFLESVPEDPFDGRPLHYRTLTNGFVLYSVDTDGHDDGGREPPDRIKSTDTNSYDITFIVER